MFKKSFKYSLIADLILSALSILISGSISDLFFGFFIIYYPACFLICLIVVFIKDKMYNGEKKQRRREEKQRRREEKQRRREEKQRIREAKQISENGKDLSAFGCGLLYGFIFSVPISVMIAASNDDWSLVFAWFLFGFPFLVLFISMGCLMKKDTRKNKEEQRQAIIAEEKAAEERFQRWKDSIVSVEYLGSEDRITMKTKTNVGSAIGRSIAGGMVGGEIGAIIGASTAVKETTAVKNGASIHKFFVSYRDGHTSFRKEKEGSREFYVLMQKVNRNC